MPSLEPIMTLFRTKPFRLMRDSASGTFVVDDVGGRRILASGMHKINAILKKNSS
jgi:hypothetical protein